MQKQETVFVGLSGGVDSSVAALRLLKDGYNVVGVFIKVWHPEFLTCDWEKERLDAMRVAAHLGIPFLTLDAVDAYKQGVADYLIDEYRAGRIPNPDVMCNDKVKFGAFLKFARSHGAAYIATGHYARIEKVGGAHGLARGTDTSKDQSYFLWTLTEHELAHALFPVGDSLKKDIRREAEAAGLPTAKKRDSQGICFLGAIDMHEFLSHYIDLVDGPVLDTSGTQIGMHHGALTYTIGQRHGFTIDTHTTSESAHYVVSRDIDANTITVAATPPTSHEGDAFSITHLNLRTDALPETVLAQSRYRQTPFPVRVRVITPECAIVDVLAKTEQPPEGQSLVLYDGDTALGGGIIQYSPCT